MRGSPRNVSGTLPLSHLADGTSASSLASTPDSHLTPENLLPGSSGGLPVRDSHPLVDWPFAGRSGCPSPVRTGRHGPPLLAGWDQDGAANSSPSRSASRITPSHSGQLPPSPTERPK